MSQLRRDGLATRMHQVMVELREAIAKHYPTASFLIGPGGENGDGTYLTVQVDLDDPDEVLDLVIDRVLKLQLEEGLPVHVTPIRTPERVADLARRRSLQFTAKGFTA